MAHVRVWKFKPREGLEQAFADAYSGSGPWSRLFARAIGYRGTTLLSPVEPNGWWMTLDRWRSLRDFDAFTRDFAAEYEALDAELEEVAGKEEFVGPFEEPD